MSFVEEDLESLKPLATNALKEMQALESGAVANPDEGRKVGHYWLRDARLASTPEETDQIKQALSQIQSFTQKVHEGSIQGKGGRFQNLLVIGIGGSALGPQFVAHALAQGCQDKLQPYFFDNTDPDGMDRVIASLDGALDCTLSIVISKSGGTKETRNGMLEAKRAYETAGLSFEQHAVAITSDGSQLDQIARSENWLEVFPMWDWVGGRTSELSAVGLLPAALQGLDIQAMLDGARDCDVATREEEPLRNPAALLAMMWYHMRAGVRVTKPWSSSLTRIDWSSFPNTCSSWSWNHWARRMISMEDASSRVWSSTATRDPQINMLIYNNLEMEETIFLPPSLRCSKIENRLPWRSNPASPAGISSKVSFSGHAEPFTKISVSRSP